MSSERIAGQTSDTGAARMERWTEDILLYYLTSMSLSLFNVSQVTFASGGAGIGGGRGKQ